jgi:hypothetical protein
MIALLRVTGWGPDDEPIPINAGVMAWAARVLRRCEMPPDEVSAVLGARDPELVRRFMELHRERLEEGLVDRLQTLAGLERFLVQAALVGRRDGADTRTASHHREGEVDTGHLREPR